MDEEMKSEERDGEVREMGGVVEMEVSRRVRCERGSW